MISKFSILLFACFLQIGVLEEGVSEEIIPWSIIKQEIAEIKSQIAEIRDAILGENLQKAVQDKAIIKEIKDLTAGVDDAIADIHVRNPLPTDCKDAQARGATSSGPYRIKPRAAPSDFMVYCDFTLQGGGWAYVINRMNGLQDFQLEWSDYKMGFGDISKEHWLGLEHLYELTNSAPNELLFELILRDSTVRHVQYDYFRIGTESYGYTLLDLGGYSGNGTDQFKYHRFMRFSTKDRDNDEYIFSCAKDSKGAWWHKTCYTCQLTGHYLDTLEWVGLGILREARMMIRPRSNEDPI